MTKPIVAIVGRPNVGKSTLFNKLAGARIAIVEDTPGVTRDRIYADVEWCGKSFTLIDTGGIEPKSKDVILSQMRAQANLAIEQADVIILMVDVRTGLTATDQDVASMLKKSGKPVIVACNKVDSPGNLPMEYYEFFNLGLKEPVAVSSIHGMGVGDLLDAVTELLPEDIGEEYDDDVVRVALCGKPNVGKSSMINKILGEERVIVSDVPGTTRDAIDTYFEKDEKKYVLVDTAGMRKRGKIDEQIEHYSVVRSLTAIERANVCVLVIDASEGVSEQDTKIAGFAHEKGRALIIVVNKWDKIEKDTHTMSQFENRIREMLAFVSYAPILFVSAKTGQRLDKLFEMIDYVNEMHNMRLKTGTLNDIVGEALAKNQAPSDKGRRLKVYYSTQATTAPPTFVLFVNDKKLMHFSYLRYLENQIRDSFDLSGTPVRFVLRERKEDKGNKKTDI